MVDHRVPDGTTLSEVALQHASERIEGEPEAGSSSPPHVTREIAVSMASGIVRPPNFHRIGAPVPFRVPGTAEGMDAEWMTQVFRFRGYLEETGTVTKLELKALGGDGLGAFGELVIVNLELSGARPGAPTSFIAKFAPQGKTDLPRFVVKQTFKVEAHFYNDFTVADGGLPRPECYGAFGNLKAKLPTFVIFMQNMMPATTYTRVTGLADLPRLKMVMSALASLHARWWDFKKAPPLEWLASPQDYGGALFNVLVFMIKKGLPALQTAFGDEYKPVLAWRKQIVSHLKYIKSAMFSPPYTLCHGDVHVDNIFFDDRFPGGCAIFDFGNMTFSPGMSDVSFFMSHNLEVDVRRKHEKELIQHYHAELLAKGVSKDDYPWEKCWYDYRFQLFRGLLAVLILAPSWAKQRRSATGMFAAEKDGFNTKLAAMYAKYNERVVAALTDHEWLDMLLEGAATCGPCSCLPCCP